MKRLLLSFILLILCLGSCAEQPSIDSNTTAKSNAESNAKSYNANLLTTNDLIDISVSAPEGSGAIRTLTIRYTHDGKEESAAIDKVRRIDLEGYDDEKKEQTFTVSDYDGDGIFDIIVYREFWFPDLDIAHAEIPEWPAIYEYNIQKGFVVASAKHKDYFKTYVKASEEQLAAGKEHMSDVAMLALSRLIYAAEYVVDGSFTPQSKYNGQYYEDVYARTKDIKE